MEDRRERKKGESPSKGALLFREKMALKRKFFIPRGRKRVILFMLAGG